MATLPVKQTPDAPVIETVEERFRRLEATWMAEVGHHSSTTKLVNHPAFQEIIRMGNVVVPFSYGPGEKPRLWCGAGDITGADPVPVPTGENIAK